MRYAESQNSRARIVTYRAIPYLLAVAPFAIVILARIFA